MNDLIHRLGICAQFGIRRIREHVKARRSRPRRPPLRVVFAVPSARGQRLMAVPDPVPVPAHVAARMRPIDGDATALVRPYLRRQEVTAGV